MHDFGEILRDNVGTGEYAHIVNPFLDREVQFAGHLARHIVQVLGYLLIQKARNLKVGQASQGDRRKNRGHDGKGHDSGLDAVHSGNSNKCRALVFPGRIG